MSKLLKTESIDNTNTSEYFQPDYPARILKEYKSLTERALEFSYEIQRLEGYDFSSYFLPTSIIKKEDFNRNFKGEENEKTFKYYFKSLSKKPISYNYNAIMLKDLHSSIYKKLLVFPYCICSMDSLNDYEINENHNLSYLVSAPWLKHYIFECISPLKEMFEQNILTRQVVTTRFGFEIPNRIEIKYPEAINLVAEYHLLYEKMIEKKISWIDAQYCTLLGHRVRYIKTIDSLPAYIKTEVDKDIYQAILNKDPGLIKYFQKPTCNIIKTNRLVTAPKSFKEN